MPEYNDAFFSQEQDIYFTLLEDGGVVEMSHLHSMIGDVGESNVRRAVGSQLQRNYRIILPAARC